MPLVSRGLTRTIQANGPSVRQCRKTAKGGTLGHSYLLETGAEWPRLGDYLAITPSPPFTYFGRRRIRSTPHPAGQIPQEREHGDDVAPGQVHRKKPGGLGRRLSLIAARLRAHPDHRCDCCRTGEVEPDRQTTAWKKVKSCKTLPWLRKSFTWLSTRSVLAATGGGSDEASDFTPL